MTGALVSLALFERAVIALALFWGGQGCQKGGGEGGSEPAPSAAEVGHQMLGVLTPAAPPAKLLVPGSEAPDFVGLAHTGAAVRLYPVLSKPVLLLFYPGNGSPSAERLFKVMSDHWLSLQPRVALVLAIAPHDSVQLTAYATAGQWPFLFVADRDQAIRLAYGAGTQGSGVAAVLVGRNHEVLYSHSNFSEEPQPIERLMSACPP